MLWWRPYLVLLAYDSMPINARLCLPAEMLYQWVLHTTVPQQIRYTDPHADAECDHLSQHVVQSADYRDQWGCHKKPPLFAGQTISVLNDMRNLWLPATIICKASNGSYLVHVIGGGQYRCAHDHIWECHPNAVKPAAFTSTPATQVVRLPTAVAPVTPTPAAPAAILQTPHKALHAVHSPPWTQMPSTGAPLSQTSTAPAVLHPSPWSRKPPSRLLEEI